MDTTKVRYGVARIFQGCLTFFAQTFGLMVGIVLALAAVVLLGELIGNHLEWFDKWLATRVIAVFVSFGLTRWLLLVVVVILWNNNVLATQVLDKLKDIESALSHENRENER